MARRRPYVLQVCGALAQLQTEVAIWGGDGAVQLDADIDRVFSPTYHRLSVPARAFKAHALIAARRPALFEPVEPYWATPPINADIRACI